MPRHCTHGLFASLFAALFVLGIHSQARGDIIEVTEEGLGGDAPAIIESNFGEDSLTFSDRTHQHNGAAFDADGVLVTPTGPTIVPLPAYLVGNQYVRFANNARDQAGYSATVTADTTSRFYLLVDNRVNGPAGNTSSPNSEDPVLGGTLQWVVDGGWQRVNTGISPNGQADYTGVDEGGDQVGPGQGLNQFYAVYQSPTPTLSVTVSNNGTGGSNMISLVAVPEAVEPVPALSTWGLVALVGLLMLAGAALLRRRVSALSMARA